MLGNIFQLGKKVQKISEGQKFFNCDKNSKQFDVEENFWIKKSKKFNVG